jgi:SAM-dependent methyltransferase
MTDKKILDPCCGSRMFWFDRENPLTVFGDIRNESHILCDGRTLNIHPDIIMDFRAIPFPDNAFKLVVFDPPHLKGAGEKGWQGKKYGILGDNWKEDLRQGFEECFRVLKQDGVMVFKWNEHSIKLSSITPLIPYKPLLGHRSGAQQKTHWLLFMKNDIFSVIPQKIT